MDKKTFKSVTNQCFINQGFKYNGKLLYKENEILLVNIELDKSRFDEIYYVYVYIWIKDLHQDLSYTKLPLDYDMIAGIRFLDTNDKLFGVAYLNLEIEEYLERLSVLIPKHIDPIFEENIQYLKRLDKYRFSTKAKEYLERV